MYQQRNIQRTYILTFENLYLQEVTPTHPHLHLTTPHPLPLPTHAGIITLPSPLTIPMPPLSEQIIANRAMNISVLVYLGVYLGVYLTKRRDDRWRGGTCEFARGIEFVPGVTGRCCKVTGR